MITTYEVNLQNCNYCEDLKEKEDIVVNVQYSSEKLGNKEILSFPHGILVKDKEKNETYFVDNRLEDIVKVRGLDVEQLEWALPYFAGGTGASEEGVLLKLKDGRIIRRYANLGKKELKSKSKYRFVFTGSYLIPLYKTDVSKKKLAKLEDKIYIFGTSYPSDRKEAKKKVMDYLNSTTSNLQIWDFSGIGGVEIQVPIEKLLLGASKPISLKNSRKLSTISLENVEKGSKSSFNELLKRALNNWTSYGTEDERLYKSIYAQKYFQSYVNSKC